MEDKKYAVDDYNFKHAMKENIGVLLEPLLYSYGFKKYGTYKYVREVDRLAQFFYIRVEIFRIRAYAFYLPIFIPYDDIINYGIEITGSSGINLLNGKYFATIYEEDYRNKEKQLNNYYETEFLGSQKSANYPL